ncbi:suppressor protein SRP40-like [Solanum pennellii]|uniref:Suppressor protein SRP40-like n=1 Tax=Solanum pennellii TaxID=28526 RepID=A0ABM1V564_SOLPN|nr:suppressor protein SRP40-like [Solanum pennellii]
MCVFTGKREAENEIDKRRKKKRPALSNNAKLGSNSCDKDELVAPSSKNHHNHVEKSSSSDDDDSVSSKEESSTSDDDDSISSKEGSSSSDDDRSVSEKEESSSSDDDSSVSKKEESSSSDDEDDDSTSSAEDDDDAVSKMEESPGEGSSTDNDDSCSAKDDAKLTKVKKTSSEEEPHYSDSDSDPHKGKAVVLSKMKVDNCDDQQEIHCGEEPWNENETQFLITILYVELVMHEKDVNQLDWAEIVQKLYHQTHKQTSVTQVQALYKKFRDQTNQFMDLLKVVGYEWNPNNNNVTCNDEVWEHIYWIHGGDKLFRNKGLLHYNLLSHIFGSGNKHFVQESHVHVQRIAQTTSFTSTRLWRWLFG